MKAVAYYRVSTASQGRSGLGLEAQRRDVEALCTARGFDIIADFTEVESGKRNDRPQLTEALRRAKLTGATLVVAKLDRLSRSLAFVSALQESGARFIAADMPEANELTVGVLAAVARQEGKAISQRTRDGLAIARERAASGGTNKWGQPYKVARLGNPNGAAPLRRAGKGNAAAIAAKAAAVDAKCVELAGEVASLRKAGAVSLRDLAGGLNERRIEAPRGGNWHPSGVKRLLFRLDRLRLS
ncbi:recombinase family protein [Sphingorhabdus soli]|uniref:Recombinase family protein n=1 Tax=Flavisphingopyxis soli TaxID=2601267 RepID=A0A5C6U973_9SPHN|nr:recombinase family protein [Sphingorhabdus soli]TXC68366.1 recombinase family protein [Sphingorhabdus soli]